MKQHFLMSVLMALPVWLYGQTGNILMDRIIQQVKLFPQEKTYIHTNATDYLAGDRVWMKVYVVNAVTHEPQSDSQYVYVELISPDGIVLKRIKLIATDGLYMGYVDIPAMADSGPYKLRSYTQLMTNLTGYEDIKTIYVSGSTSKRKPTIAKKAEFKQDAREVLDYERQGDSLRILVNTPHESDLYLMALCRANPFFFDRVYPHQPLMWHRDSIPQGVVSLLLVDNNMKVKAHQLMFSDNESELCPLNVTTNKTTYQPEEEINLRLNVPTLQAEERVDLSVSVTLQSGKRYHQPSSIVAHLMLASELQGGLTNPEYFYAHPKKADSLLQGKTWKRYNLPHVFRGHYAIPHVPVETSQCITGRVSSYILHKPVAGSIVNLISPQIGLATITTTDNEGRFRFTGMDYPDGTQYVLMATRKKGSELVNLTIDEPTYPEVSLCAESDDNVSDENNVKDIDVPLLADGLLLEEVVVTGTRRNPSTNDNVYAKISDFSFGLGQIEELRVSCLHELIRRIPGVFIREDKAYIRAHTSIFEDNPAVFAIDGIIMEGDYDLDNIPMQDVARVDVFKTGSTVIWGARGGSGVISITTKGGHYEPQNIEKQNQQKIEPLGYQRLMCFTAQEGKGRTLYWNPSITENAFRFTAPTLTGNCCVVIEGVTSTGRLIHEELIIHIQ